MSVSPLDAGQSLPEVLQHLASKLQALEASSHASSSPAPGQARPGPRRRAMTPAPSSRVGGGLASIPELPSSSASALSAESVASELRELRGVLEQHAAIAALSAAADRLPHANVYSAGTGSGIGGSRSVSAARGGMAGPSPLPPLSAFPTSSASASSSAPQDYKRELRRLTDAYSMLVRESRGMAATAAARHAAQEEEINRLKNQVRRASHVTVC
jgi:hypothetical protein